MIIYFMERVPIILQCMVDKREGRGIGARVIERNITPIYTNDGFKRVVIKTRGGGYTSRVSLYMIED